MISAAKQRLVFVAPALTRTAAAALAARMEDLPALSLTIILDADPEVYRMGYGEMDALETIRFAAARASFRLREQPGVRIGLIVSDDRTLIYSPAPMNIEAGSTSDDKPNALLLGAEVADLLAEKTGATTVDTGASEAEIGGGSLSVERVAQVQADLKQSPPLPVDLTRRLNVFMSRVQYVELKAKGYQLSKRRAELPPEFVGLASADLRDRVTGRIRTPMDGIGKLPVTIDISGKEEKLNVDEAFLQKERQEIEKILTHVMPKRGRVILRKDRESFDHQIKRFEAIIAAYQTALAEQLQKARANFRKSFVDEFLVRWKANPPARYSRRIGPPAEDDLRQGIEDLADQLFEGIVKLDGPDVNVVYKEIALEDLRDEEFLNTLREVMKKGGVSEKELSRLFQRGTAVAEKGSFNIGGDSA
ncbi:hypothetical protein [Gemmobacter megaterium]|nr:hypothetical protein [Gemmobacter megaterium]